MILTKSNNIIAKIATIMVSYAINVRLFNLNGIDLHISLILAINLILNL